MTTRTKRRSAIKIDEFVGKDVDQNGFKIKLIDKESGYGVFVTQDFEQNSFLLEYAGTQITLTEALAREDLYDQENRGSYIYFNITGKNGKKFCIDATDSRQAGRYVNDSPEHCANCSIKRYENKDGVFLILKSKAFISSGTELRYDYNDDVEKMSWRTDEKNWHPRNLTDIKSDDPNIGNAEVIELASNSLEGSYVNESVAQFDTDLKICSTPKKVLNESKLRKLEPFILSILNKETICERHQLFVDNQKDSLKELYSCLENWSDDECAKMFRIISSFKVPFLKPKNEYLSFVLLPEAIDQMEKDQQYEDDSEEPDEDQTEEEESAIVEGGEEAHNTVADSGLESTQVNSDSSESSSENDDSDDEDYIPDNYIPEDEYEELFENSLNKTQSECSNSLNDNSTHSEVLGDVQEVQPQLNTSKVFDDPAIEATSVQLKSSDGHLAHYCKYCNNLIANKITRHFQRHHADETDVAQALALPVRSKGRSDIWKRIEREGDAIYNNEALDKNQQVIGARYIQEGEDAVMCFTCKGMFMTRCFIQHQKRCLASHPESRVTASLRTARTLMATNSIQGKPLIEIFYKVYAQAYSHKDLQLIIRNDQLLLKYLVVMVNCKDESRYQDIRYGLKLLAQILQQLRKKNEMASGKDLVLPENYEEVKSAVLLMSGYKSPSEIENPNVLLNCGYRLSGLATTAECEAVKSNLDVDPFRRFSTLYKVDFKLYADNARLANTKVKQNKPEELPLEADVQLFRDFCVREITNLTQKFTSSLPSGPEYRSLCKLILGRSLTFNARRGAECSKLTLDDWSGVISGRWKSSRELELLSDPVEKALAKRLEICYVKGKGKASSAKSPLVPILFTQDVVKGINVLLKHRALFIQSSNQLVLATGGDKAYGGWDTLQSITKRIPELEMPRLITPTRARKFLATMLQLMDLNDGEMNWVTSHMGHTKDVHFAWYRKENTTIELTKMARILSSVDENENLANKRIGDLQTDQINEVDIITNDRDCQANNGAVLRKRQSQSAEIDPQDDPGPSTSKKPKKRWIMWNAVETKLVKTLFAKSLAKLTPPSIYEVREKIAGHGALLKRGDRIVREKICNILRQKESK